MAYVFNPFTGSFDSSPTVPLVDGLYLPLSGGTLTGPLSCTDSVYIDGSSEIGSGLDTTLFVDDTLVGINTETPNEALTIVGNVSATGTIYSAEGSSVEWQNTYTNLVSNSAAYLSSVDLSFLSVSANWDSVYSSVLNTSANWDSVYNTVQSNSATNWNYQGTDIKALTSNWESTYTTFRDASSTFLTSETDAQTLSFDETTKDLTISNGNSVSLSALVDTTGIDTGVRALTSNWESTYNTVSALSASWSAADEILIAQVSNADSVTLNRGDVVYTFGATGDVMSVKLASNSAEATSSKTLGIINETIIPNGIGYATVAGRIDKMSFPSPFVEGDALWLGSTPGTFTRVKPIAPNHLVYLGVIERANNGNGIAYIKVQNGYELDEIHDVYISSLSAGDVLQRNSTNTLWINAPLSADMWNSVYTTVNTNSATFVTTVATTTPGISAVTNIVAVSALPASPNPNTLYIIIG